jgi:hypothetical protein
MPNSGGRPLHLSRNLLIFLSCTQKVHQEVSVFCRPRSRERVARHLAFLQLDVFTLRGFATAFPLDLYGRFLWEKF